MGNHTVVLMGILTESKAARLATILLLQTQFLYCFCTLLKSSYVRMCTCTKPNTSAPWESHQLHLHAGNEHGPGYVQPAETILCCLQSTTAMSFQCWLWCSKQKCHFCFALSSCCALGCSKLFSACCYQARMLWIWKKTSGVALLEKLSQPCSIWINCVPCCTFA